MSVMKIVVGLLFKPNFLDRSELLFLGLFGKIDFSWRHPIPGCLGFGRIRRIQRAVALLLVFKAERRFLVQGPDLENQKNSYHKLLFNTNVHCL